MLLVAGFFLWRYFGSYESTDDAQIDGHLNSISARVSGHVIKLLVKTTSMWRRERRWSRSIPRTTRWRWRKARADYSDAEATAESLQVNVPITSVNTGSQVSVGAGRSGERTRRSFDVAPATGSREGATGAGRSQ